MNAHQQLAGIAQLPERDLALLELFFQHRFLTRRQIQTFFFADHHDARTGVAVATRTPRAPQRRLHQLLASGFIARRYLTQPDGRREPEPYYCLTADGARLVAARNDSPLAQRRRRSTDALANPLFVRHALAGADLHCALVSAARAQQGHLCKPGWWRGEDEASQQFTVHGRTLLLCPDGYTHYQAGGDIHHLLVEIDLGTMPLPRLQTKLERYRAYARSGAWHERYPVFPKLLLLTTTPQRIASLHKQLPPLPELVLLSSTTRDVQEQGPLAPVWQQAGQPEPRSLLTAAPQ